VRFHTWGGWLPGRRRTIVGVMDTRSRFRWLERWRERRAGRRVLRAERRSNGRGDFQDAARRAEGDAWSKGRFR
jgi:hypothetical protein